MKKPRPQVEQAARNHAAGSGLIYVSDAEPGIRRQRRGKGFMYLTSSGRPVKDEATLARIRGLAIPPAYTDVWICAQPRGHLQATGRDARGRKQYRYHPKWRDRRSLDKFSRLIEFGRRLPLLRRRLKRDLALPGLPREKVLAVVVTLLSETLIRVGNKEYARTNQSYGLTTLRDHHVKFLRDGRASFSFRGKGGRRHDIVLDDKRLARLIRRCQDLPGQQLFQYLDDEGSRQPIDSGAVNDYLREAMGSFDGEPFTAKDFRTWGGTLHAISCLCERPHSERLSSRAFNRCVADTAKDVSEILGNTPAVCRKSYINPAVFDAWRSGRLSRRLRNGALSPRKMENLALALLRAEQRQGASLRPALTVRPM